LTTLLQCPNCFAPLPPPGSGHATCRFCGATSIVKGGQPARAAQGKPKPSAPADPIGAKALALDFQAEHGVDVTKDGPAMERLGNAWSKAVSETASGGTTTVNLPFLFATKSGPIHYERELDAKTIASLYAVAKKRG
jgi:hypothetical protein